MENSKHEIRNSKQIQMIKTGKLRKAGDETPNKFQDMTIHTKGNVSNRMERIPSFWIFPLEFILAAVCFGFRASDLEF